MKTGDVKCQYKTKHAYFEQNYTQSTKVKTLKLDKLKRISTYTGGTQDLVTQRRCLFSH